MFTEVKYRLGGYRELQDRIMNYLINECDIINEYITPICWSVIRRLYNEHTSKIRILLSENTLQCIDIILPRLKEKLEEWNAQRVVARSIYVTVAKQNHSKSLDFQTGYRSAEKRRMQVKELWRELIEAQIRLNPECNEVFKESTYMPRKTRTAVLCSKKKWNFKKKVNQQGLIVQYGLRYIIMSLSMKKLREWVVLINI